MILSLIKLVTGVVGGIRQIFPQLAAYLAGRKAATADQQEKALKIKKNQEKIRKKNKDLSTSDLLKKAKKYRRD